ncbi:MAG: helix-turn-helix domain-containing protein [Xanthomonadales bacterium]|jgi:excisionase family DNA binding protein|nr:helix-turn-helix domain-containing protein [Xanthomonadales bacterium]
MLNEPLMTVHDAADFLRVRESTVRALINDKRLRAVKVGKEWRIDPADLLSFLNENANRDPDDSAPISDSSRGSTVAGEGN